MPKVAFSTENKAASIFDYPKLYLDKGERARIVCIEPAPEMEWTHTLRAPRLEDGKPVMEKIQSRDGGWTEQPKYDFIGRHICVGKGDVIDKKGVDVKGCPVCAASTESDAVAPPERRFAMHIIRYKTKPGSFTLQEPFSVELIAWAFGNKQFNTITDLANEWGDLKKRDLLLGPCEVKMYQKFEINVANGAEWLADENRKKIVAQTYAENQAKDLTPLIGRRIGKDLVLEDLQKVLLRTRLAFGGKAEEPETAPAIAQDDAGEQMDMKKLLMDSSPADEEEEVAETPPARAAEKKADKPEEKKALDWEGIFDL